MAVLALREVPRLLRTVSRLKPAQIGWRLRYLVQRQLESQSWFRVSDRIERRLDGIHAGPSRPDWTAEVTPSGWLFRHAERRLRVEIHPQQSIEFDVVPRPWHPEFGREVSTQRLVWSGHITLPFRLTTVWTE
jgi:hypothetical protein